MGSQSNTHCPICFNIYIEPIDLPCDHCLCKPCFEELIKKSNMQCPFCRRRIGSWTRLHTRKGSLVNVDKWNYIQTTYPEEVNARLAGKETPRKIGSNGNTEKVYTKLADTGEIRTEYENEIGKLRREQAAQEAASERLIKQILAQDQRDQAAISLADKENKPRSSKEKVARKPLSRRSSSIDSITGEFSRHFKPIVRYPRTPPRPGPNKDTVCYPETITPCPQTVKRLDFSAKSVSEESVSKTQDNAYPVTGIVTCLASSEKDARLSGKSSDVLRCSGADSSHDYDVVLSTHITLNINDRQLDSYQDGANSDVRSQSSIPHRIRERPYAIAGPSGSVCSSSQSSNKGMANYDGSADRQDVQNSDISPDELFARKLQNMYEMENKYKLNSIRCPGSGNEYNTRKRKRN